MQAEVEVETVVEHGLKLPNGTEIYPPDTWHGRGVETPEDRKVIINALVNSANELGIWPPEDLLNTYAWVAKERQVVTMSWTLNVSVEPLTDQSSPEPVVDAEEVAIQPDSTLNSEPQA